MFNDQWSSRGGVVVPPLIDSINLSIKGSFNELKNSFNELSLIKSSFKELEKSFKDFQLRSEESLSTYTPVIFSTQGADWGD